MESRYPAATYVASVWALPLSLAATNGITVLFSFHPGTKMFQFPDLPHSALFYSDGCRRHSLGGVAPFGYPRILACNGSPRHFAVCCVLHRLLAPRYPPCALCSLTNVCNLYFSYFIAKRQDTVCWSRQTLVEITDLNMQFSEYGTGSIRPHGWSSRGLTFCYPSRGFVILPDDLACCVSCN